MFGEMRGIYQHYIGQLNINMAKQVHPPYHNGFQWYNNLMSISTHFLISSPGFAIGEKLLFYSSCFVLMNGDMGGYI